MKISTNWIKDYVKLENVDLKLLSDKITNAGVNIEEVTSAYRVNNLVVGEVIDVIDHPNSDHLHICKVNIGSEILQIVCGASNVREGLKVIVSLIGAILPGNFEIKKSKIRDVESFGMLCSLNELGFKEENNDGICELSDNAVVGDDPYKYLNVSDDTIYTLDLNPNRSDCLSHLGFAYEVAASLNTKVNTPNISHGESNESIKDINKLQVNTNNCSLILLKLVKNVEIKKSPKFIQERLTSVGMRSINNVVDISNYIMLEYGQPLHFYDADKLGNTLGVRMAYPNERVITIDSKERILNEEDIVITNGEIAVGIAGVMGGESTEVDENTKNILIESAIFDPLLIRKTSIKLDLRSEASLRFEKGLNYEYTYEAIDRACNLLEEYAKGNPCKDTLIYDKVSHSPKKASVTLQKINNVLGITLTNKDVEMSLEKLGFEYTDAFNVTIPNRRIDVSMREDLIEEIGRMYGYDKIIGTKPIQELKQGAYHPRIKFRKDVSKKLRGLGLNEVKTYNLTNEKLSNSFNYENKEVIILNRPISQDKTHLRTSLVPSLLEVEEYNHSRGIDNINIYEISNTYYKDNGIFQEEMKLCILLEGNLINNYWNENLIKNNFYTLKGIVENLLHYLGLEERIKFEISKHNFIHPAVSTNIIIDHNENENIGFIGEVHPNVSKRKIYVCEINLEKLYNKKISKLKYFEPSKYPSVKRDVAFIVDNDIFSEDIVNEIKSVNKKLITECYVFDEYKYECNKSLAFSIKFESNEKTLTDIEVEELFKNIINKITKKCNAILRNK